MNYILAKNDKQLGICLRMLFPKQKRFKINPVMNDRGKNGVPCLCGSR